MAPAAKLSSSRRSGHQQPSRIQPCRKCKRTRHFPHISSSSPQQSSKLQPPSSTHAEKRRVLPWGAVVLYIVVFLGSVCALLALSFRLPRDFNARFPHNLEDVRDISHELSRYNTAHGADVFVLFSFAYIFKQTFSIPGSAVLNLLAGSLFGAYRGFLLVCLLSATGASCCFLLSRNFGEPISFWLFGDKIESFRRRVESTDNIFWMLLSMCIFPFTPNFFLNSALPLVGVRLDHFFASVFFGLMPYCFVTVKAGLILDELTNVSDAMTPMMAAQLGAVALILLVPMLLKNRLKKANGSILTALGR